MNSLDKLFLSAFLIKAAGSSVKAFRQLMAAAGKTTSTAKSKTKKAPSNSPKSKPSVAPAAQPSAVPANMGVESPANLGGIRNQLADKQLLANMPVTRLVSAQSPSRVRGLALGAGGLGLGGAAAYGLYGANRDMGGAAPVSDAAVPTQFDKQIEDFYKPKPPKDSDPFKNPNYADPIDFDQKFQQYMGQYNEDSALDRAKMQYLKDLNQNNLELNAANIYNPKYGYGKWTYSM